MSQSAPVAPAAGQSRYGWLAAMLRAQITQGQWAPGTAIPSEAQLARQYGVALGTLRQAIAVLVSQGLLERQHGRGTFVCSGLGGASMMRFFRWRHGAHQVASPGSRILQRRVQMATPEQAQALELAPGASVLNIRRLRSDGEQPLLLEFITLPLPQFEALVSSDTALWGDLLYPLFQRVCGTTVQRAEDQLGFGLLTASQARLLHLSTGHPCVRVQRQAFDLAGRCIEWRTTYGDAFAFEYTAQVR